MSKFKSFASQGSFGDYQIVVPDESQKILEQKREVVRGREKAEKFRQGNASLYLQAQKLAQGLEEQNREQNFKLETENRQAFQNQLNEEYKLQVQADQQRLSVQQKNLAAISQFSQTALKLGLDINNQITENQRSANAAMVYKTGADYKTLVGIQALGDNITKAEFAQLDFIQAKVKQGGNIDGFWELFQRRKTRGFIDNVATVQNTAYGYGPAVGQHMSEWIKQNPGASLEAQEVERAAFRDSFIANNFTVDGRSISPKLLNSYAFPIIRNYETQQMAETDRQRKKQQQEDIFAGYYDAFNTAFGAERNFQKLLEYATTDTSPEKLLALAKWGVIKSKDMDPTGLSYEELNTLLDTVYEGPNFKDTGKYSTLRADRGGRPDVLMLMEARDARRKRELEDYNLSIKEEQMDLDIELNSMYEGFTSNGSGLDDDEYKAMEDRAAQLPTYNSKVLEAANRQRDSVRTSAAWLRLAQAEYADGKTVRDPRTISGLTVADEKAITELRTLQLKEDDDPIYTASIEAIKSRLSQDPRIKNAPITGKYNETVILKQAEYVRQFKKLYRDLNRDANQARGLILTEIDAMLAPQSAIVNGRYADIVAQEQQYAKKGERHLQGWYDALEVIKNPETRNNYRAIVDGLGAETFDSFYQDMASGKTPTMLRNMSDLLRETPFDLMNKMAAATGVYKPLQADPQIEQIRQNMKPIASSLFNAPYRTNDTVSRGNAINSGLVSEAPTRFGPDKARPLSSFAPQVSSIVMEADDGEPGLDIFFEDKKFPAMLPGVIKEIGWQGNSNAGLGNYVVAESIDEATGLKVDVLYSHLAVPTHLKKGSRVVPGMIIGIQGGTGSVRSADGTIASVDFLEVAAEGSKSMKPYKYFRQLRERIAQQFSQ